MLATCEHARNLPSRPVSEPVVTFLSGLIRRLLAYISLYAGAEIARQPDAYAMRVLSSQGFDGIESLLETLRGDQAASLLRRFGASVGADSVFAGGLAVQNSEGSFERLRVGTACHIGRQVFIDLAGRVEIGDRVTLSMRTTILSHVDPGRARVARLARRVSAVVLEDDCYVGAGAILLPGVRVGAGAIVGAGAVVTRDVPPGEVVVGVPSHPMALAST